MVRNRVICISMVIVWGLLLPATVWGAVGDLAWETPFTFLPQYDTITVNYTALSATTFILSGNAKNASGTGGQLGFIKAFDVATGNVKWEKTLTVGVTGNNFGIIAINGDIALVKGSYLSASETPPTLSLLKALIRAYHADTGQLLWEVLRDFEHTPTPAPPGVTPLLTANNRAFTYFTAADSSGLPIYSTFFVRAYQVRNIATASMLLLEEPRWPTSAKSQGQ